MAIHASAALPLPCLLPGYQRARLQRLTVKPSPLSQKYKKEHPLLLPCGLWFLLGVPSCSLSLVLRTPAMLLSLCLSVYGIKNSTKNSALHLQSASVSLLSPPPETVRLPSFLHHLLSVPSGHHHPELIHLAGVLTGFTTRTHHVVCHSSREHGLACGVGDNGEVKALEPVWEWVWGQRWVV